MRTKKNIMAILSVVLCASAVICVACNSEKTPEKEKEYFSSSWEVIPENTNKNLKYFGFFHCDGFLTQGSYMEEIAALDGTNVFMINSQFNDEAVTEKFALAKKLNHKVILSLHGLFSGGQVAVADSATLATNYREILEAKTAKYKDYIDDGTILSFYFDEPAWNGIKQDDFRTVTKWLRDNCPTIKVMTTMTTYDIGISKRDNYPELDPDYNEYCTDVMYDSYVAWNDATRRTYLEALKSKALQNQYIWGCATGFVNNPEQNGELYNAIKGMYTEAIQDSRYAGIISFSYADGLEGDWGYGMHSFLNEDSDYYDRQLKQFYVNIGRAVMGLDAKDFSGDVDLQVYAVNEVFEVGEEVMLPTVGATDSNGNDVDVTWKITSPSGKDVLPEVFVADESGLYEIEVSAGVGEFKKTKKTYIAVRYANEISVFDSEAYTQDAGGSDSDKWCWPRQVTSSFSRSGGGSLKVTPHATDGTWPRIIFNRNLNQIWDLSKAGYVSMWVYNDGTEVINGFGLVIGDEDFSTDASYYTVVDLLPKTWTEIKADLSVCKITNPDLDLSKATIFYGNCASDYENRATFYIDDVFVLPANEAQTPVSNKNKIDFEKATDIARIGTAADDVWTWPCEISNEQKHGGDGALKVTVRQDGGVWPNVVFAADDGATWNLTDVKSVSVWVYIDGDGTDTLGFKICNMNGGAESGEKIQKTFEIAGKTWTKITIEASDITGKGIDLTKAYIKFSQLGGTYTNRANFYLDDFEAEFDRTEQA